MSSASILEKATIISRFSYSNSGQSRLLAWALGFLLQSFLVLESIPISTLILKIRTKIFNMTYETLQAFYPTTFVQSVTSLHLTYLLAWVIPAHPVNLSTVTFSGKCFLILFWSWPDSFIICSDGTVFHFFSCIVLLYISFNVIAWIISIFPTSYLHENRDHVSVLFTIISSMQAHNRSTINVYWMNVWMLACKPTCALGQWLCPIFILVSLLLIILWLVCG